MPDTHCTRARPADEGPLASTHAALSVTASARASGGDCTTGSKPGWCSSSFDCHHAGIPVTSASHESQCRRPREKRVHPESRRERADDGRDAERRGVAPGAPCSEERQQHSGQGEHAGTEQSFAEECGSAAETKRCAGRPKRLPGQRQAIHAHRHSGEEHDVRDELVHPWERAQAPQRNQHGRRGEAPPEDLARRQGEKDERERDERSCGKTRGIVRGQQPVQQFDEGAGDDVDRRRLFDERFAREGSYDPVARPQMVEDDPEGVRLVRLPRIVADKPEQNPCGRQ